LARHQHDAISNPCGFPLVSKKLESDHEQADCVSVRNVA
jgi:hypothetical protein